MNANSGELPGGVGTPIIDWEATEWNDGDDTVGVQIPTGARNPDGTDVTVTLDMDGEERIRVSVETLQLSLLEFVSLHGSAAFEKGPGYEIDLQTGDFGTGALPDVITHEVDTMTIGGQDLHAFVGFDGPYWVDTDGDGQIDGHTDSAFGLAVEDLDFGLVLMNPSAAAVLPEALSELSPTYFALDARVDNASLVGQEEVLTMEGQGITVQLNSSTITSPLGLVGVSPHVNFATSFESAPGAADGTLEVPTGRDPVLIGYDSELIKAVVEYAEFQVAGVVQLVASAAFVKGPSETVTLTNGTTREVSTISVGISNGLGFAGIDGPYWRDTDGNGRIELTDTPNDDALGLVLKDLDAGLLFMRSTDLLDPAAFLGLKASIGSVFFTGIDGIEAAANDLKLELNLGGSLDTSLPVVDFTASFDEGFYAVETGGDPVNLDFNRQLLRAAGEVQVNLYDLVRLDGAFDFELSSERLLVFADAEASVGPESFAVSLHASGLLVIDEQGLGVRLNLEGEADFGSALELTAEMTGAE